MVRKLLRFLLKLVSWFFALSILSVIFFRFVPIPYTPLMFIRLYEQKKEGKSFTLKHDWVSIDKISPNLQKAVIVSEDGHFLSHNGFDFKAIEKAMKNNEKGKRIKGEVQSRNKRQKTFFFGLVEAMFAKGSKPILRCLLNSYGLKSVF